jgi:hypothetical protein
MFQGKKGGEQKTGVAASPEEIEKLQAAVTSQVSM